jgi:hypothetical protein
MTMLRLKTASATGLHHPASADSEMMYGMTLVTTARLTSALNCSESVGEMVDSAIAVCTIPDDHARPGTGGSLRSDRGEQAVAGRGLGGLRDGNCQPSSDGQASTASP